MTQLPRLNSHDLRAYIDANQIAAEIVILDAPTPTVEAAAEVAGTAPRNIVKSILFLIDGEATLALSTGDQRVEYKALAVHFGISRKKVKLAKADETLAITGYQVGSVPPFGHRQPLPTLMDELVLELDWAYAGGGEQNALVRLTPEAIRKFSGAQIVDIHTKPA
ncbi:MAG: YbaK/EbsC family protein [Anaerolineales bacterium]|nr:YbaK/EbsC family protein [Anaerolineales bacterium]